MRDSEHPQRCSVNRYAVLHFVIESAKDVFSTYLVEPAKFIFQNFSKT